MQGCQLLFWCPHWTISKIWQKSNRLQIRQSIQWLYFLKPRLLCCALEIVSFKTSIKSKVKILLFWWPQCDTTNIIISSHTCDFRLLPPTAHLPSVSPQGTASMYPSDELIECLYKAQPQAPVRSSVPVFFIFLLLLLFFAVLSVNLNHTSTQTNWQNCMYEVPVPFWIFGAEPHVIMCMWARNCTAPESQLRVTRRERFHSGVSNTWKYGTREPQRRLL